MFQSNELAVISGLRGVRIPAWVKGSDTRIELRTLDATCNPYLAYAAISVAGIDRIVRRLDARKLLIVPHDSVLPEEKTRGQDTTHSLEEALTALDEDHQCLLAGDVFSEEDIEHWTRVKRAEQDSVELRPHPHEFTLYYDL